MAITTTVSIVKVLKPRTNKRKVADILKLRRIGIWYVTKLVFTIPMMRLGMSWSGGGEGVSVGHEEEEGLEKDMEGSEKGTDYMIECEGEDVEVLLMVPS